MATTHTYTWRRLDIDHGLGQVRFGEAQDGQVVTGSEVAVTGDKRWVAHFYVELDALWRTRVAVVAVSDGEGDRRVRLDADGAGNWRVDDVPTPELDGCLDVDIGAVPFTNTFVLRRIGLAEGDSRDVRAAFVDVPDLVVQPLPQTYRRLGEHHYQYGDTSFGTYDLEVDAAGIVVEYSGFATRV